MERRETNITVQGKHYSVVSHTPPTGSHPWHLSGLGIELVAFQFVGQHPTHRATPFRQGTFVRHFSELSGEILLWRTGSWDQDVQINMRTRITALEGLTVEEGSPDTGLCMYITLHSG